MRGNDYVLPEPIIADLFTVSNKNVDMAVDFITDYLEASGFAVSSSCCDGLLLTINFQSNTINSKIIINRLEYSFTIEAIVTTDEKPQFILPVTGTWSDISKYLMSLRLL